MECNQGCDIMGQLVISPFPHFKPLYFMYLNKWMMKAYKKTSFNVFIVEVSKIALLNLLGKVGRPFKGNLPTPIASAKKCIDNTPR